MRNLKTLTYTLAFGLTTSFAAAQVGNITAGDVPKQEKAEQQVKITNGPNVTGITGTSATIKWTTDSTSANHVKYRPTSGGEWKEAFNGQGSKDHAMNLSGLQPNTTYEYQIMTRLLHTRTSGQFKTAATAAGTMPDVNGTGGYMSTADASTAASTTTAASASSDRVALYRAVNSNGAHAFVLDQNNVANGFRVEGVSGYLMKNQVSSSTKLYALKNQNDYFYTTDESERQRAIAAGFSDMGVAGWIATSQLPGTKPMYRLFHSNGQHFYTTDENEKNGAVSQGWKDEGITGYVWAQ